MNSSIRCLSASRCLVSPLIATKWRISLRNSAFSFSSMPMAFSYSYASISSSSFSHLLSCALYFTSAPETCSRYSSFSSATNISGCLFSSLSGNSYGGAISSTSSYAIRVYHCLFISCLSTYQGGGIYVTSSNLTVTGCCFSNCYVTTMSDEVYFGNAIYCLNANGTIEKSMYTLCGPSASCGGDGAVLFNNGIISLTHNNATNNRGDLGSVDADLYYLKSGSVIEYQCILNTVSGAHGEVFHWGVQSTMASSNFINLTGMSTYGCVLIIIVTTVIEDCCFYGNTNSPAAVLLQSGAVSFVNCVADINTASFTYYANPSTLIIGPFFPNGCTMTGTVAFSSNTNSLAITKIVFLNFWLLMNFE